MDLLHKALNWVSYNRALAVVILLAALGCTSYAMRSPRTNSLHDMSKRVDTRTFLNEAIEIRGQLAKRTDELNSDIATFNEKYEFGVTDLEAQERRRQAQLQFVGSALATVATGLNLPEGTTSIAMSVLTLFSAGGGVALLMDNRRKDGKIKDDKARIAELEKENQTLRSAA